jgi:single-strand DNA-binding protein
MTGYLNQVQLIGNLGHDPDMRTTRDGKRVAILSIATAEIWKDERGDRHERVEWHRVVVFNENLARNAEQYLKKGAKVFLEGKLVTRKWTDSNNQERSTTEVQVPAFTGTLTFLSSRNDGSRPGPKDDNNPTNGDTPRAADELHDDIPF